MYVVCVSLVYPDRLYRAMNDDSYPWAIIGSKSDLLAVMFEPFLSFERNLDSLCYVVKSHKTV
jgi:hypothetical protein